MKKFSKGLVAGVFLLLAGSAHAQNAVVQYKNSQTAPGSVAVTPSTPLPVTGTFSATTAATASSTLPSLSAGTQNLYESLSGGLYSQLIFGGTIVGSSNGLPVNVVAGGTGGGAVYGPTANGSPAANPPVLLGGTVDGTATGNVGNLKVDSSGLGYVMAAESGTWTVQAAQSGVWNLNSIVGSISLPTGAATSASQTNGNQKTQIVDGSGNVIASTSNNLNVQCANCSGSGASAVDEAAFTAGTSVLAPGGGFYQTTATSNPLTNGQQGMVQMTAQRAFFSNLRNASGTEVGTASTPLQVSVANTGANGTAMLVTGTGGTFPISGATSNASSAVATSSTNAPAVTYNYGFNGTTWDQLQVDGSKNLKTVVSAALPAGSNAIGTVGVPTWAGGTLGAMANYGTSPGAVLVPGVNSYVTNTVTVTGSGGTFPVTQSTSPWIVAGGGTAGTPGTAVLAVQGVSGGTNIPVVGAGTAGTPSGGVVSVQGVASGTVLPTNTAQVNGITVLTGTGATGTGAQRVTVSTDQATNAGAALVKGGVGVVNGGSFYLAVAASQTATVLQSSTGAAGDYLSHCVIYPTSTSPGVVTVFDSTNTAANSAILFPGGATSTSNLVPFAIPVGAVSVNGAWKVTTGANVSVVCYGKFS